MDAIKSLILVMSASVQVDTVWVVSLAAMNGQRLLQSFISIQEHLRREAITSATLSTRPEEVCDVCMDVFCSDPREAIIGQIVSNT